MPLGLLTSADSSVLERMARGWALYRLAAKVIQRKGPLVQGKTSNGADRILPNPMFKVMRQAAEEMDRCGMQLGLSPYARTRLTAPGAEEEDPLALLLDGRRLYDDPKQIEGLDAGFHDCIRGYAAWKPLHDLGGEARPLA